MNGQMSMLQCVDCAAMERLIDLDCVRCWFSCDGWIGFYGTC